MKHLFICLFALALCVSSAACQQGTGNRNARNPETEALLSAARGGHADTLRSALAAPGVDVNATDERGNTALIEAARFGHDDAVRALLAANANARAQRRWANSPEPRDAGRARRSR